jgi:hypothetical protein
VTFKFIGCYDVAVIVQTCFSVSKTIYDCSVGQLRPMALSDGVACRAAASFTLVSSRCVAFRGFVLFLAFRFFLSPTSPLWQGEHDKRRTLRIQMGIASHS